MAGMFQNQTAMSAGEIAPDLYGGVDHDFYVIGLRTCRNFMVKQYGGAANRPGTRFIAEAKDSSKALRIIPFQFNEIQTYVLELGHQYMRIIKEGGEVLETAFIKNITNITSASQAVFTSAAHGFSNGDDVYIASVLGLVELNGRTLRVSDVTANTFKLKDFQGNYIDTTGFAAYISGGMASRIYTVATPWTEDDLFDLNFAQSADVITIVHPDYPIRDITRTAHDAWTVTQFVASEGPFKDINAGTTTVYASAVTGIGITLTASVSLFTADDVGTLFYLEQNPTDATKTWEVQKGIRTSEIRRAGFNYYQAPTAAATTKIFNAITLANPIVITCTTTHGFVNDQVIYIAGVAGTTELNGNFYKVVVKSTTAFSLKTLGGTVVDSTTFTAYVGSGTAETAYSTGTIKPDHVEGTEVDGDPGTPWTFLHSGFGIVQITAQAGTTATATVIKRLPDNVAVVGGASTVWAKASFSAAQGYPAAVTYHKRRLMFGGTTQQPNNLWMSSTVARTFFGKSKPIEDDDSIQISMDTNQVNAIRHLMSLKSLLILTSSSEQKIAGDVNGDILATSPPNPEVQGYNGSSKVRPLIIGNSAVYAEDTGDVVRSLQYEFGSDSFTGIDLTARSPHLFRQKTIIDWAYQKRPYSIIWTIQDDGSRLLGFTYMPEQKTYAWHRHDTNGTYKSVCSIREGKENAVYQVVEKTVNGTVRKYVERHASRIFSDIEDAFFVDCGLTYDGRNTGAGTLTITGGTTWDNPEVLTITSSAALFKATDVGDQIQFVDDTVDPVVIYRLDITAFTSSTVVSAIPTKALPVAYQAAARTDWRFARRTFRPFDHLEGQDVIALVDGNVVRDLTVTNGAVTIPDPGAVVHIGEGFVADLETLDIANPGGQMKGKTVNIPRLFITAQETRGIKVAVNGFDSNGTAIDKKFKLVKALSRTPGIGYDAAIPAGTDLYEVQTNTEWSKRGRICIRQPDPLPVTINAITDEVPLGYS